MKTLFRILAIGSLLASTLTGCSSMNHTQRNSLVGSTVGTTAGAIIGHQSGHGPKGAVIGAVAGGVTGALVGNAQDDRDAAIRRAEYAEGQLASQSEPAMTNNDLIRMRSGGLSDDIIINAIRSRGGRFDLSPEALIGLRQAGVSEDIIREIQSIGDADRETTYLAGSRGTTTHFVVVPRPRPIVHIRPAKRRPVVLTTPRRVPGRVFRRR